MRTVLACVAVSLSVGAPAAAQSASDRFVVSINAGIQTTARHLSDHFEFERNIETATVDVRYPSGSGVLVDGGVGIRLWKRLGAGLAVSRFTHDGSAHVEAAIPHPFLLKQPRAISGEASSITRTETGVHLQLLYTIASSRRFRLTLSGGPSRLELRQELVSDVLYDESYPYDTATFRSATTHVSTASKMGGNAGFDVSWMLARHFGVGGMARFTRSSMDLTADTRHIRVEAGGVQAGAGVRVMF